MAIIGLAGRKVSALAREVGSACLAVVDGQEIGGPTPDSRKPDKRIPMNFNGSRHKAPPSLIG
jgi:hypothetical protein